MFLLSRQVTLQLFQSFNHLLLGLCFGGLLTTANCTITRTCTVASQISQQDNSLSKTVLKQRKCYITYNVNHILGFGGKLRMRQSSCECFKWYSRDRCTNLQPLVDGLSCSELSRLKAFELLGGDGLWEFELWGKRTIVHFTTK